jgi:transposase
MANYIGMDAHSKTSMFVVVNSSGKEIKTARVNSCEKEITNFLGSLRGKKHLTFEECQLSRWLHVITKDQVDELVVCNPCFIPKRKGPKNDYQDALHLAQQLRGGFLTPVFHDDTFLSDLRKVVASYENVVVDLMRAKCRFKALFTSRAIPVSGTKIYKTSDSAIGLLDPTSQFVARSLLKQIDFLSEAKLEYKRVFEGNTNFNNQIKLLTTIPGIAAVRANLIAGAMIDPKRFPNKYKFWSYCMLVKHDRTSDGKSYGKVSNFGKISLKGLFMSAAADGICGAGVFRDFYDSEIAAGKDPAAARKNLARKIAAISLAVMRTEKPFDEKLVKKKI